MAFLSDSCFRASGCPPVPLWQPNIPLPVDFGYAAWDFEPVSATTPHAVSAGIVHIARIFIHHCAPISTVLLAVSAPSSALTPGACYLGIYDESGLLIASTDDISTHFMTAAILAFPSTSTVSLTVGSYFVALLLNGSIMPNLWSAADNLSMLPITTGVAAQFFDLSGSFVSLPASFTATQVSSGTVPFWVALA